MDEVLRSRLLLAHYSNILQALIPAQNAVLLNPALLGGFPFPSQAFAGGFEGGRPSAALLAVAANQGHPLRSAAGMSDSPPSAGLLLAALSAASCSAPLSGGGGGSGGDGWLAGYNSNSWN